MAVNAVDCECQWMMKLPNENRKVRRGLALVLNPILPLVRTCPAFRRCSRHDKGQPGVGDCKSRSQLPVSLATVGNGAEN